MSRCFSVGRMSVILGILAVAIRAQAALNDAAQTYYWTGAADAYWTNASNWEMEDGSPAATAPGVVGVLSKPEEWVGHKLDTAIFDGARFKSLSPLALNVQGLLCVGYVTVQGATTPAISFGTGRGDAQCFRLYNGGANETATAGSGGVFTIAADVVNMPTIPYPGLGGLFDNNANKTDWINYVNNAPGKTFTFLACGAETIDPTAGVSGNPSAQILFTGAGDFSLGGTYNGAACGGISSKGQRFLTFNLSGGSSLTVTNFTSNTARYNIYGTDENEHTVTIAEGSLIYANNLGYAQIQLSGKLNFVGGGAVAFCDRGEKTNYPLYLTAADTYVKFQTKVFYYGATSGTKPSAQVLPIRVSNKSFAGGTVEFNNPDNVIPCGIEAMGVNLTAGAIDKDGSAVGGGPITIKGRYAFTYTGGAAVMTNNLCFGYYSDLDQMGGKIYHNGTGRLQMQGGVSFEVSAKGNVGSVIVTDPDAELEIFGGFKDNTTSASAGLGCTFYGEGRVILHGEYSYTHKFSFGVQNNPRTKITVSRDVSFAPKKAGVEVSFASADVTFEGTESGEMETLSIPLVELGSGQQIFRMTGARSVKFASISEKANFSALFYRETADQQLLIVGDAYQPTKGSTGRVKINDYTASEFNLDCSVRPYVENRVSSTVNFSTGMGTAANGGVLPNDSSKHVGISHDGTAATGTVTLPADETTVGRLIQKGRQDALVSLVSGQTLTAVMLGLAVDAGDFTIGTAVGVGSVSLSENTLYNADSNKVLTVNATLNTETDKWLVFRGVGPIDINGPIVGDGKLDINGSDVVVTLNGANTYTGTTYVEKGTLRLGADNVIPATSSVSVGNGTRLDLNNHSIDLSKVTTSGTGTLVNGTGDWAFTAGQTIDFSKQNVTFAADDVITILNPATVLGRNRSRYVLAVLKEAPAAAPALSAATQAALGAEWRTELDGTNLMLVGPKKGLVLMVR